MKRGGAVLGAVLVMVLALAGAAHADHAGEMKARESFAAGRYDEALELFAKLYAETLNPIYLRNIGRCHQKLKQPDKAIDAFHDYLAKGGKKISADEKAEINGYIKEMEALRDEQASKQQAPPPVAPGRRRRGAGPADPRRRSPRGRRPATPPSRPAPIPGQGRRRPIRRRRPTSSRAARWWRSRRRRSRSLPGRSTPSGGSGRSSAPSWWAGWSRPSPSAAGRPSPPAPPDDRSVCEATQRRRRCCWAVLARRRRALVLPGARVGGLRRDKDSLIVVTVSAADNYSDRAAHPGRELPGTPPRSSICRRPSRPRAVTVGLYVPSSDRPGARR